MQIVSYSYGLVQKVQKVVTLRLSGWRFMRSDPDRSVSAQTGFGSRRPPKSQSGESIHLRHQERRHQVLHFHPRYFFISCDNVFNTYFVVHEQKP
jgi:hypothetical protein